VYKIQGRLVQGTHVTCIYHNLYSVFFDKYHTTPTAHLPDTAA
jgi:hypothetical protein